MTDRRQKVTKPEQQKQDCFSDGNCRKMCACVGAGVNVRFLGELLVTFRNKVKSMHTSSRKFRTDYKLLPICYPDLYMIFINYKTVSLCSVITVFCNI